MAVPYEKIVEEDLNLGTGTVSVTMPGGGSAVGNKIGLQSFPTIGFAASRSTTQAIATGSTPTVVQNSTEELDTNAWYDPATYTFTPLEAGVYFFVGEVTMAPLTGRVVVSLCKNGTVVWQQDRDCAAIIDPSTDGTVSITQVSGLISCNGTTDAITLRVRHNDESTRNVTAARLAGAIMGNV
jgi:hypothetical protein